MPGIFDRINQELEQFGRKAQAAFDEGKLQLERLRLKREQDAAARMLGLIIHRRERGQSVDPLEVDAYMVKLDNLETSIARVEREIAAGKGESVSVSQQPAPASAAPVDAKVES